VPRRLIVPRVTVDFSDVQDFEVLPKGEYGAVIAKAEWREPQDADKYPYVNLEFDVKEVVNASEDVDLGNGRKLWAILSTSPKALWRMKQVFENLGIFMEELDIDIDDETNAVLSPELVGLPCHVTVSKRVYEGREQNQVDAITSTDGGTAPAKAKKPAARRPAAGSKTKTAAARKFK
jgi:Protein of unknown function (DUF669)